MPTRNVVLSDHQQALVDTLVRSGRYQNASEVLRDGLRMVEQRERVEAAKLASLQKVAQEGLDDLSAGRFTDVADDQLDDYLGHLGRNAVRRAQLAG